MTATTASPSEPLVPIWIVNCMENKYPGMWQRWFRNQCVAVGWPPGYGYRFDGESARPSENAWVRGLAGLVPDGGWRPCGGRSP